MILDYLKTRSISFGSLVSYRSGFQDPTLQKKYIDLNVTCGGFQPC